MRGRRGQSTVELALTLPLLLLLVLGIVDFGRVFVAANVLSHATSAATRYGSINPTDLAGIRRQLKDEASRSAVTVADTDIDICYLDSAGSQKGCSTNGAAMSPPGTVTLPGDIVRTRVHLAWRAQTTVIQDVTPANLTLNNTAAATVER